MKNTTKALVSLMCVLLLFTLIPLIGHAAVPQQMTYQGQLTDQYGDPVPDGEYLLSFSLYDVPTGSDSLWGETQTVTVTNGIYTVILGQPGNELDPTHFASDLYLGVTVDTDTEMTPRQHLTSVGYALRAQVAESVKEGAVTTIMIHDGAVETAKLADNAITESKIEDGTVTTIKIEDGATLSEIIDDDGAGSGLDADLFDGQDSSSFMSAGVDNWVNTAGDTMTGRLEITVASGDGLSSTTASTAGSARAIVGYASAISGATYGVWGVSSSTSGRGVVGWASRSYGTNYGVYGQSDSTDGSAMYGYASASSGTSYGVYGQSNSTDGNGVHGTAPYYGVHGYATASSGPTVGVHGRSDSTSGSGVQGLATASSGTTYGVRGESSGTSGRGVSGVATATTGTNYGVWGQSESTSGSGVHGTAPYYGVHGYATAYSGTTYGVYGKSRSTYGRGVYGEASRTGSAVANYGGYFTAAGDWGTGVCGSATSTSGVGVYGYAPATSGATYGVYGRSYSTSGRGVVGKATASSGTTTGVQGDSWSTSGYDFYAIGVGVNYGPFTGAHEVKLADGFPQEVKPGLIVAATGTTKKRHNPNGSINLSSTLPTVKLADAANDKAVFGALVAETTLPEDHWYAPGEGERFASVNALGEGRVWVSNSNGALVAGDYITTSSIPGYGQKQADDLLHSYTLGKAIEKVNWDTVTETVEFNGMTYKVYLIAVVYTSG